MFCAAFLRRCSRVVAGRKLGYDLRPFAEWHKPDIGSGAAVVVGFYRVVILNPHLLVLQAEWHKPDIGSGAAVVVGFYRVVILNPHLLVLQPLVCYGGSRQGG